MKRNVLDWNIRTVSMFVRLTVPHICDSQFQIGFSRFELGNILIQNTTKVRLSNRIFSASCVCCLRSVWGGYEVK